MDDSNCEEIKRKIQKESRENFEQFLAEMIKLQPENENVRVINREYYRMLRRRKRK